MKSPVLWKKFKMRLDWNSPDQNKDCFFQISHKIVNNIGLLFLVESCFQNVLFETLMQKLKH